MAAVDYDSFWGKLGSFSIDEKKAFLLNSSTDLDKLVEKLSDDSSKDLSIIVKILIEHDYNTSISSRLGELLDKLRLNNKIDSLLAAFESVKNTKNLHNTTNASVKAETLKTILVHLPNISQINRFVGICNGFDEKVVGEMFSSLDLTNAIERYYARNVLSSNNFDNPIMDYFSVSIIDNDNPKRVRDLDKLMEINKDFALNKNNIMDKIFKGKEASDLQKVFEDLSKVTTSTSNTLGNRKYLEALPQELKADYIDYLFNNNNLHFEAITSIEERANIIKLASKETREKIVAKLSEAEKDQLEQHMSAKFDDRKAFKQAKTRVDNITREMAKIAGGNDKPGLKREIKGLNSTIKSTEKEIKKIKKKLDWDEKKLNLIIGIPEALDRIGFIENFRLKRFMEASKRHDDNLKDLDTSEKKLEKAKTQLEDKKAKLEESKEKIRAQRDAMRKEIENFKMKKKEIKNPAAVKALLGREMPKKKDKIGKEVDKLKLQQAMGYIVQRHEATGESYNDMNIEQIITDNKSDLDIDEVQLKAIIQKIQMELKSKSYAKISEEDFEESIRESAGIGRSRGISNYVLIMAVTAVTITGLIILLTMILS